MADVPVPGATIGVVGGGQLGRMLAEAASPLGVEVVVLDPTPDCPAVPPAADQVVGAFDDGAAVRELAARADVLTYEIELADPDLLEAVTEETGVPVHPDPESLRVTRDKLVEKRSLAERGVPVPEFRAADDAADVRAALDELGSPVMVKARQGGYDGRGNVPVDSPEAAAEAFEQTGPAVVEEFVEFAREVSVIGVRGDGETATFPVGENVHETEILRETVVPARTSEAVRERALEVAREVLDAMSGRGVFGIELFETPDGEILVNEIAPRPHNSGHYTIEGAVTSQFEQHARSVLGLPLGSTALRGPTAMANILGDTDRSRPIAGVPRPDGDEGAGDAAGEPEDAARLRGVDVALDAAGLAFHWYGKREVRPLRKLGHVTAVPVGEESVEDLLARVRAVRDGLTFE